MAAEYRDSAHEYQKRLGRYCKLQVVELPEQREPAQPVAALQDAVRRKEGEALLARLRPEDYLIALCIDAKQHTSEQFAGMLAALKDTGRHVAFAIGGSLGLSEEVQARADASLSLSALTFPHQLARIILLEQLYRGFRILSGERYHK
jgi:23S rRNA (pseudouridine1915-N3)-methyltransferase